MSAEVKRGQEVKYFIWNSGNSNHDEFRAIVRAVVGGEDSFDAPDINLSYIDVGSNATNVNNARNIEDFGHVSNLAGNDYWDRNIINPDDVHFSQPFSTTRPVKGDIIWFIETDVPTNEEIYHNAVVRAVLGPGTDEHPQVNLFFVDPNGDIQNENTVDSVENIMPFPTTSDYWGNRILGEHDDFV